MFQNNNSAVVRRLTTRSLNSNKKRNFFIIMAIMLTTFLIGSVFSIGMSLLESVRINQIRFMGTVAHAAIGHPTASQIERLKNLDYVKVVGLDNNVGFVDNTLQMEKINLTLHYFDKIAWEQLRYPAYMDIEGSYPQKENEIMVSRGALERLGIDNPFIGMEISLTYYTESGNSDTLITEDFRLSGWFTSYTSIQSKTMVDIVLVSEELSQRHGKTVEKDGSANVIFDNSRKISEYCNRLAADLGLSENQPVAAAKIFDTDEGQTATSAIALCAIVVFLIFTGYLLIYNVLYISVSRDVRFFGLLKTLGTTPKQIKTIVIRQIIRLCMIGIPIGLIFALLFSLVFVPVFITKLGAVSTEAVISFSPFIYISAAVFAMLTAVLGAMKPAKKAAGISPIEAQKYTGEEVKKNKVHLSAHGKPYKMALRNIFRDKKRAGIVLLSLFLGITTFLSVTTLVLSMNIDQYIDSIYTSDFSLYNDTLSGFVVKDGMVVAVREVKHTFDDAFLNTLAELPGIENMSVTTKGWVNLNYSEELFGRYLNDLLKKMDYTEKDAKENFVGMVIGVGANTLEELNKTLDWPVDVNAFDRGEFALIVTDNPELFSDTHDLAMSPLLFDESGQSDTLNTKLSIPLGGFVPSTSMDTGSTAGPTVIVSNSFMEKLYGRAYVSEVNIDISDNDERQALDIIKQLISNDYEITLTSKVEAAQELYEARIMLFVLGGGIALVIAFIGILNFVNIMSVSVMVRKHELATLESIGMSRKQIKKLLIYEGLGYAVITLCFVLSVGNAVTYGIFRLFQQQAGFAAFTYPFIPVVIVIMVIGSVCFITPQIIYRSINKKTIVEKLREAE